MDTDADEIEMLKASLGIWAQDRELIFVAKGEVGFCRPCVGITDGNSYVDLGPNKTWEGVGGSDGFEYSEAIPEALPPAEVTDAYHKHDCLAVLVHGDDYDAAIHQLFQWVQKIDEEGLVVKKEPRQNRNVIELALNGSTHTYLEKP